MLERMKEAAPRSLKSSVKINRARLFETVGSARYSKPAINRLDEQMLEFLPDGPGVFLEIGANDGYSQSNTWFLERRRGWRGILIEPLPSLWRTCRRVRTRSQCFNVACVGASGPPSLEMLDLNLRSIAVGLQDADDEAVRTSGRRGRLVTVPTRTLSSIIDEAATPRIDFMSIDVEGAELEVLAGLDLDRHAPGHLLVETKHPDEVASLLAPRMELTAQLSHHDYVLART